ESEEVQAYWDIPVFVEYNKVRAKRMHARIVDHQAKTVTTLEMSCPWIQNREKKDEEKVLKLFLSAPGSRPTPLVVVAI
ncbi:unnamed protein product, partial [Porites lobata]